jgi:voltage-gated potassium channel
MRALSRFERQAQRAVVTGRALPYLAGSTLVLALVAGFIVTIIDRESFPTFGDGVWWAIVTIATVGYGDIVPQGAWGRVVGSVVIILGVTTLAFLTAMVTSYFITAQQERSSAEERERREASEEEAIELLRQLETRLERIESRLDPAGD